MTRQYPDAAGGGRHDVAHPATPEHKDSEYETPVRTSQRTELNVIVETVRTANSGWLKSARRLTR